MLNLLRTEQSSIVVAFAEIISSASPILCISGVLFLHLYLLSKSGALQEECLVGVPHSAVVLPYLANVLYRI